MPLSRCVRRLERVKPAKETIEPPKRVVGTLSNRRTTEAVRRDVGTGRRTDHLTATVVGAAGSHGRTITTVVIPSVRDGGTRAVYVKRQHGTRDRIAQYRFRRRSRDGVCKKTTRLAS